MAAFPLTDVLVIIGGITITSRWNSIELDPTAEAPESTAFGDEWRTRVAGGLKDWSVSLGFIQDFAASNIDAVMWPLLGTQTTFEIRPTSASPSVVNPAYRGNVIVTGYPPLSGGVGDLAVGTLALMGDGELQRHIV